MTDRRLVDSDVLIDYLRGRAEAITFLESLVGPVLVSSLTVAELYAGVREGRERQQLDRFMQALVIIPVSDLIAVRGGLYRRDYRKSHNTGIVDAIVAATAEIEGATLVTLNRKHFPMVSDILVPYQKP